ncbi:MAG: radical SAM protein [Anaerolineae bacterium]|nr:radical SAM protein [Anaerolineae bacterium]
MYVTGECNLACRHCWITPAFIQSKRSSGERSLPYDLFVQAIREGEPLGLTHVKFTGGEPLVHPDLEKMLLYVTERELGITIETNGTLITASFARFMREETNVRALSVSLDGATSLTHDSMRGVQGSFESARRGVQFLVDVGFAPQVIMSIHEGNLDEIRSLAEWASSVGCSSLKLNIIQTTGRGSKMGSRITDISRLIEIGRWVTGALQPKVSIPIYYSWPPAFDRLGQLTSNSGCTSCSIFNILGILHTGQVSMCGIGVQVPELLYGQIGHESVAEIWVHHPTLLRLREDLPRRLNRVCGDCVLRDTCFGFCVALNYQSSQELTAPFWFCELADKAGLFPESRKRVHNHPSSPSIKS